MSSCRRPPSITRFPAWSRLRSAGRTRRRVRPAGARAVEARASGSACRSARHRSPAAARSSEGSARSVSSVVLRMRSDLARARERNHRGQQMQFQIATGDVSQSAAARVPAGLAGSAAAVAANAARRRRARCAVARRIASVAQPHTRDSQRIGGRTDQLRDSARRVRMVTLSRGRSWRGRRFRRRSSGPRPMRSRRSGWLRVDCRGSRRAAPSAWARCASRSSATAARARMRARSGS